jgi:hypothetical protein
MSPNGRGRLCPTTPFSPDRPPVYFVWGFLRGCLCIADTKPPESTSFDSLILWSRNKAIELSCSSPGRRLAIILAVTCCCGLSSATSRAHDQVLPHRGDRSAGPHGQRSLGDRPSVVDRTCVSLRVAGTRSLLAPTSPNFKSGIRYISFEPPFPPHGAVPDGIYADSCGRGGHILARRGLSLQKRPIIGNHCGKFGVSYICGGSACTATTAEK